MSASRGIALVAVLALLACLTMLMLATALHVTASWLAARNLREGTLAWSRAESAGTAAIAALGEAYRRDDELPASFGLVGADEMHVTLAYVRTSHTTATLEVIGRAGKAAVRHEIGIDMNR